MGYVPSVIAAAIGCGSPTRVAETAAPLPEHRLVSRDRQVSVPLLPDPWRCKEVDAPAEFTFVRCALEPDGPWLIAFRQVFESPPRSDDLIVDEYRRIVSPLLRSGFRLETRSLDLRGLPWRETRVEGIDLRTGVPFRAVRLYHLHAEQAVGIDIQGSLAALAKEDALVGMWLDRVRFAVLAEP